MEKVIGDLLSGNSSIIVLLFGFLLTYFVWDIIKKINRVDTVAEKLESITTELASIKGMLSVHVKNGEDIAEMKAWLGKLSHRVVALETRVQLEDEHKK